MQLQTNRLNQVWNAFKEVRLLTINCLRYGSRWKIEQSELLKENKSIGNGIPRMSIEMEHQWFTARERKRDSKA